jgi:predicted amidohydrolase YtcJ
MDTDTIIKGNFIFDGVREKPFFGFIAIKDKRIFDVQIGMEKIEEYKGRNSKIIDCENKLIMPGFHDSHTHLLMAALYKTKVNFINARSEEECAKMASESAANSLVDTDWVLGFNWYHVFWDNKVLPTKKSLDKYFPDRPVFLLNAEGHGAWVNSKALEIAGVNKNTPDPEGGYFARDDTGEPTGFLYEKAIGQVSKYAFEFTPQQEKELIKIYLNDAKKNGITSVNDMKPYFHGDVGKIQTYADMEAKGELTCRINVATDLLGDLDQAELWRDKFKTDMVRANLLKQFLDGVCTTHTALMLEEYYDDSGNYGIALCDLDEVKNKVVEAHKKGFCIRLHSCGDKSARLALDFYENAIKLHGKGDCRHGIEHLEIIKGEDISRFQDLGVIPSMQPEHLALTQTFAENPYPIVLGSERANKTWPLNSLYNVAGVLAIGSDCPVVDNNPFLEIYRAVTRVHNDGEPKGGWNPSEKLNMFQVLRGYTYGSAYGVCREDELGTLEKGKFADIVVIDKNLFNIPDDEILNAKVDMTILGGKVIYDRMNS